MILNDSELREQFIAFDMYRCVAEPLGGVLEKIFQVEYFKGKPVDMRFVHTISESIGISSVYVKL